MAGRDDKKKGATTPDSREDRLKAALKANLAKRKAQARKRAEKTPDPRNKEA